jgi:hypothetical protein
LGAGKDIIELDKIPTTLLELAIIFVILSDGKRVRFPRGPAAVKGTNPANTTVLIGGWEGAGSKSVWMAPVP